MPGTVASGRHKIPVKLHEVRGTYRKSRHSKAAQVTVGPPARPGVATDWRPTPQEYDGLSPKAKQLLDAALRLYRLDEVEGQQALLALRSLTMVEAMEAEVREWTVAKHSVDGAGVEHLEEKPHPLLPAIARERRLFLSAWSALRLGR
jgi:hypothetical protein